MKVDERIRAEYVRQRGLADRLKTQVDRDFTGRETGWHYESRVKSEESFALKVEAGRVPAPSAAEDMFGCVLVVRNALELPDAISYVQGLYGSPVEQRPPSLEITRKRPYEFLFDDLRLYFVYREADYLPESDLTGTRFEVQIRTFLQHAWAVATHDVVYKAGVVSWRRERIAHQIRASLEQAEVAIERMEVLEQTAALPRTNEEMDRVSEVIRVLGGEWTGDQLPMDVRRLAEVVDALATGVNISVPEGLQELLAAGRTRHGGDHNLDWSPYRSVLEYLADARPEELKKYLKGGKQRTFVYPEVLDRLNIRSPRRVVTIGVEPPE